jgi:hypothetical protein
MFILCKGQADSSSQVHGVQANWGGRSGHCRPHAALHCCCCCAGLHICRLPKMVLRLSKMVLPADYHHKC